MTLIKETKPVMRVDAFRELALTFPQTEELPHFEKTSFRVKNKIFATLSPDKNRACIKLSESDQYAFCAFDETVIYTVDNKWGLQGWTLIDLNKVKMKILKQALSAAYNEVASKTLLKKSKKKIE